MKNVGEVQELTDKQKNLFFLILLGICVTVVFFAIVIF